MLTSSLIHTLSLIWITFGAITFIILQFKTAPYGRHYSNRWGPSISNRLSWFIMEVVSPATLLAFYLSGNRHSTVSHLLVAAWCIHYFNRSFIYPLRMRTSQQKMPVVIMLSAIFFNAVNASLNGAWLGHFSEYPSLSIYLNNRIHIIGLLLFITGFIINNWADHRLIHLRKPHEKHYVIPQRGLFNYISCPNHFGEIMEWTGFALAAGSLPAISFALWTFFNLAPRAIAHHQWYQKHFDNYPPNRKALIPFLW